MNDRLRILHISPYIGDNPLFGGIPVSVMSACEVLASAGHKVTVWSSDYRKSDLSLETDITVRLYKTYMDRLGGFTNGPILPQLIFLPSDRLEAYDVVHLHGYWNSFNPRISRICTKSDIPLILQPHGTLVQSGQRTMGKRIFQLAFHSTLLKATSMAVAFSEVEKQQIVSVGIDEDRIRVIPNFIAGPSNPLPSREEAREKLDFRQDQQVVLYLGRLHPKKGVKELLLAFDIVRRGIPGATLVFVGPDGGELDGLKEMANRLGLSKVRFLGPVTGKEKWMVLRAADVFCLPSYFDAFPRAVLEAALAGIPIVLSSLVELPYLDELPSVVHADPRPEALAKSLLAVLSDGNLRMRLTKNARLWIERHASPSSVLPLFEDLYQTAEQNRPY